MRFFWKFKKLIFRKYWRIMKILFMRKIQFNNIQFWGFQSLSGLFPQPLRLPQCTGSGHCLMRREKRAQQVYLVYFYKLRNSKSKIFYEEFDNFSRKFFAPGATQKGQQQNVKLVKTISFFGSSRFWEFKFHFFK